MSWLTSDARQALRCWRIYAVAVAACVAAACGEDAPTAPSPPSVLPFALQCPTDVSGQSFSGSPVSIQVPPPTTVGGVLPFTIACTPTVTAFPVGTTRIACQASDARGSASACTFNVNVAPPPLSRTSFLAFGDSLTAGEITVPTTTALTPGGLPNFKLIVVPAESYPSELLTMLRARYTTQASQFVVTNAGVPREWAEGGASRLPQVMAATNPQAVLLLEGANDLSALGSRGILPALVALQSMVRTARGRGATVFVASLPPPRAGGVNTLPLAQVVSFNDQLRVGAPAEGAIFVDVYTALAGNINLYMGIDGLHPTEAGYQRMADAFFAAIRSAFEGR